jgi:hypothetical protein
MNKKLTTQELTTQELLYLLHEYNYVQFQKNRGKTELLFCRDLSLDQSTKTLSIVLTDVNSDLQNIVVLNDIHTIVVQSHELNPVIISFKARLNDSLYSGETFNIRPIKCQSLSWRALLKNINDNNYE